jgi:hypothetical protein
MICFVILENNLGGFMYTEEDLKAVEGEIIKSLKERGIDVDNFPKGPGQFGLINWVEIKRQCHPIKWRLFYDNSEIIKKVFNTYSKFHVFFVSRAAQEVKAAEKAKKIHNVRDLAIFFGRKVGDAVRILKNADILNTVPNWNKLEDDLIALFTEKGVEEKKELKEQLSAARETVYFAAMQFGAQDNIRLARKQILPENHEEHEEQQQILPKEQVLKFAPFKTDLFPSQNAAALQQKEPKNAPNEEVNDVKKDDGLSEHKY